MSRLRRLALLLLSGAGRLGRPAPGPNTTEAALTCAGRERAYLLHVPPRLPADAPAPLVVVLHGRGGTPALAETLTRFSALADEAGFLVAYPGGEGGVWHDGREGDDGRYDDAGFILAMLDRIALAHRVDPARVFAVGLSNGGFFAHYLAATQAARFAAIAPVIGGIAEPLAADFAPAAPVSVCIFQGTEDPIVPYAGGDVVLFRRTGRALPTEEAARRWARANGCGEVPSTGALEDVDPHDGCRVEWVRWSGGRGGSEVLLHRIVGGGHTWPGAARLLPEAVLGRACRDVDATEAIWRFCRDHPRRG